MIESKQILAVEFMRSTYLDKDFPDMAEGTIQEQSTNFSTKFSANEFFKVKSFGKSQKGHNKWIVAIKDTFKKTNKGRYDTYSLTFAEGITYNNSTVLYAHTLYTISLQDYRRKVDLAGNIMLEYLDYTPNLKSGVYLFRFETKDKTILKIGKSNNVVNRYKGCMTANPEIQPVGYISTLDFDLLENLLHSKFDHLHYKLEWFYESDEITEYFTTHPNWNQLDL